jgi:hypothetical protein
MQNGMLLPPPPVVNDANDGAIASIRAAAGMTPDQAVSDLSAGSRLGMPPDMVGMNRPDANQMLTEQKIRQSKSATLKEWMAQNPYNAAIAADDIDNLSDVFDSAYHMRMPGAVKSAIKAPARTPGFAGETAYNIIGFGLGALDYMESGIAGSLQLTGLTGGQRTGWFGLARDWAQNNAESIRKHYLGSELLSLPEEKRGRLWDNPHYLLDPEYLVFQFGDAANSLVTMLAGGAGYGIARGSALTAESMAKMGSVAGGLMEGSALYGDLLKEGVSNERALSGAISFGAVVGLLEKVGLDKILQGPGGGSLAQVIRRRLAAGVAEAGQEYAEEPAEAILSGIARSDAPEKILDDFFDSLTNVDVIPGAFLLGGGARHLRDYTEQARNSQEYGQDLMALFNAVESTNTKQLSPEHMQSALEFSGPAMREQVALPADAALELYQRGIDILSPLGFTEKQAQKAAAQGQDLTVPVAKLPAYLDRQQMEAATQILRRTPDAISAAEAARLDQRVAEDAAKIVELYQTQAEELDALGQERERLRQEATAAIQSIPGLQAQAESLGGGVDQYVGDWVNTLERYALRMAAAGQSPVETFRRVAFTSLRQARRGSMSTSEVIGEDLAEMQHSQAQPARGVSAKPAGDVLVHTGVESIDDLYALAGQSLEGFQSGVTSIAEATGGVPMFRPGDGLKGRARTEEKIRRDYPEIGAKRVLDVLGGTILYDSRTDVENALPEIERLAKEAGGEIARPPKNRFDKPASGYKDYLLNIRQPNGLITELLLTTKSMNEAKSGADGTGGVGHTLYEAWQKVDSVISDPNTTAEAKKEAKRIRALLDEASEAYYGSTGDQSNATASLSGIVEPLQRISAPGASSAISSLYGEVESLLGNIRNMLPSSPNANGISSHSINFLTNTTSPDSSGVPLGSGGLERQIATGGLEDISEPPSNDSNITQDQAQIKGARRVKGAETAILGSGGEQKARYEVRDISEIIPSHDPENQFAKRSDYPDGVQERPYHSDAGEQQKVRGNALNLDSRYVVTNNPDVVNGPPVITEDGVVLGGNSRAMSIQLAYANNSERAAAYREAIASQAASFGLDAGAVSGMERPVLVRVVEGGDTSDMGKLARLYNQSMMQGLQSKAEGVSKARLISQDTLALLAADMAEFDSLRDFLASASSKRFINALLRDGVLEQTQLSRLTENNGRLNDAGKTLVENSLRGMIVPDYDILAAAPASTLNKLDRVIPALARMKARGEGWDMSGVVTAALRQIGKATAQGKKVEIFLGQVDLVETDPDKNRPAVQALALTFANATQKEVQARFEVMARDSEKQTKGQSLLVAMPENTPAQSFTSAFLGTIASIDGQSIAPFNPQANPLHAALDYAHKNGGKGHTVTAAMDKLQKVMTNKKATAEQKAEARETISQLSQFSGAVAVYPPKLGAFFQAQRRAGAISTRAVCRPESAPPCGGSAERNGPCLAEHEKRRAQRTNQRHNRSATQ